MSENGSTCLEMIEFLAPPRAALTIQQLHIDSDESETADLANLAGHDEEERRVSAANDWVVDSRLGSLWAVQLEDAEQHVSTAFLRIRAPRPPVEVDRSACETLAAFLRTKRVPQAREDIDVSWLNRSQVGNFFCFLVAICHQTSPRGQQPLEGFVRGQRLRGWDYLFAKFSEAVRSDTTWLSPERWSRVLTNDVRELFSDVTLGDRLSDVTGRALLLGDLGRALEARGWEHVDDLHAHCEGRIATGWPNLLSELSRFLAYEDPVRKKSYFFLSLMDICGQWNYADRELLGPPVDYHEVRGHLRIGTVKVISDRLRARLLRGKPVSPEDDIAIRRAVHDAIMMVADLSEIRDPVRLHYLFWNVFRSICTRENPKCFGPIQESELPGRYIHLTVQTDSARHCPFASFCKSSGVRTPILEHVYVTDYY